MSVRARPHRLGVLAAAILAIGIGSAVGFSAVAAPSRTGILTGAILRGGGPCCNPNVGGEVSVFHTNGRLVARRHVRAGHEFHFRLPPGRYLLNGGRRLHDKPPLGCPPKRAKIRVGHTTRVNVYVGCGER
jgi:hypothetical protein